MHFWMIRGATCARYDSPYIDESYSSIRPGTQLNSNSIRCFSGRECQIYELSSRGLATKIESEKCNRPTDRITDIGNGFYMAWQSCQIGRWDKAKGREIPHTCCVQNLLNPICVVKKKVSKSEK